MDILLPLAVEHGAAVVALTIDETGMAKPRNANSKLRNVSTASLRRVRHSRGRAHFDDLTFTLATGDAEFLNSAVETIEGIRLIKRELPGVLTSLGLQRLVRPETGGARGRLGLLASLRAKRDSMPRSCTRKRLHRTPDRTDVRELCDDLMFNKRPTHCNLHRTFRRLCHLACRRVAARCRRRPACRKTDYNAICVDAKMASSQDRRSVEAARSVAVLNEILLPP